MEHKLMSLPTKEEDDVDMYDFMADEDKAQPFVAYVGWDESTWNNLQENPNYDVETYGSLPNVAPPEVPNPEDLAGVPKWIWDGRNGNDAWIIDENYREP